MVFTSTLMVLAILVAIGDSITISIPHRVYDFLTLDLEKVSLNDKKEKGMLFSSPLISLFALISFAQIPLVIMLLFSEIHRFQIYGICFLAVFVFGSVIRKWILKKRSFMVYEAAIELCILVDIVRSCVNSLLLTLG